MSSTICLLDGSVLSYNLGDQIITECIRAELHSLFMESMIVNTLTHGELCKRSRKLIKNSSFSFVGGTNLLSIDIKKSPWKLKREDMALRDLILMGVGASNYGNKVTRYTKKFYRSIFSHDFSHSVRDDYTKKILEDIGIENVVNTACPTMWKLTKKHCSTIPTTKSRQCIFTLTDYRRDNELDYYFVFSLLELYEKLYFWPQGSNDLSYLAELFPEYLDRIIIISPSLDAFRAILTDVSDLDYVGTRLHAGIYALRHKKRSLVVSVDNRAKEIAKDTGLNVIEREGILNIKKILNEELIIDIKLPERQILKWMNQFLDESNKRCQL